MLFDRSHICVESWAGVPPVDKSAGYLRPTRKFGYFSIFLNALYSVRFYNIFKIKWPKTEEKPNFGGR